MAALKLHEVRDPVFEIETAPGQVVSFDPFKLARQLEAIGIGSGGGTLGQSLDGVRKAFNFPTEDSGEKTLTDHQCLVLVNSLFEFLNGLDAVKKAQGQPQS